MYKQLAYEERFLRQRQKVKPQQIKLTPDLCQVIEAKLQA